MHKLKFQQNLIILLLIFTINQTLHITDEIPKWLFEKHK